MKYLNLKCCKCGKKLENGMDLLIYDREDGIITRLEFRHAGSCDDKSFKNSRHVKDGFEDLLAEWAKSPYNRVQAKVF